MSLKRFHSTIDGLKSFHLWSLKQPGTLDQKLFNSILFDSLAYLSQNYQGAVRAYKIDYWLKAWHEMAEYDRIFQKSGLLYVILDYYYARCRMPKNFKNSNSKRALRFQAYLKKRMSQSFSIKATERLKVVAVLRLMPDSWIPEPELATAIKKDIKSIGTYSNPEVKFNLQIPMSGIPWLKQKIEVEWAKLKTQLDEKNPQLITCIINAGKYAHIDKTVIAYDYKIEKQEVVEVFIYDLDSNNQKDCIKIHLPSNYHHTKKGEIEVFYLENYITAPIPLSFWLRIVQFIFPLPIIWYFRRIIYLWIKI